MCNDWFTIGPFTIHGYGVMIAVGILAALWMAEKNAKKFSLEYEKIDTFVITCVVGGYICSKLTYCLTVFPQFLQDPLAVLGSGGWVVYGGILGGILTGYIWCRKNHWDFMKYFNVMIPSVSLAQGFGRIGCFLAGCCYGKETTAWYGVSFPAGSLGPGEGITVIPTQLIMSAFDFALFGFLLWNLYKGKHYEDNAAWYLIIYSAGRFLVEYIRGDVARGFIGPFSTSQFIAIFTFLFGAWLIWHRQQKDGRPKPEEL